VRLVGARPRYVVRLPDRRCRRQSQPRPRRHGKLRLQHLESLRDACPSRVAGRWGAFALSRPSRAFVCTPNSSTRPGPLHQLRSTRKFLLHIHCNPDTFQHQAGPSIRVGLLSPWPLGAPPAESRGVPAMGERTMGYDAPNGSLRGQSRSNLVLHVDRSNCPM
jgi:hypothetical protein